MLYDYLMIENLIREKLYVRNFRNLSEKEQENILLQVRKLSQSIKNQLVERIFNFQNTQHAEAYVQLQQKELNNLLNLVYSQFRIIRNDESRYGFEFYMKVIKELEGVLDFILMRFTQYFDVDQPVMETYRELACKELRAATAGLKKKTGDIQIDTNVTDLVIRCIQDLESCEGTVSYRQIKFSIELLEHISDLLTDEGIRNFTRSFAVISDQLSEVGVPENDYTIKLHMILLYLNFNNREYIDHCTAALYYKMRDKTIAEKLAILKLYDKLMDQLPVKPDSKYNPADPKATEQIKTWIAAETRQLTMGINADMPVKMADLDSEQIQLGLSSSELAVLAVIFQNPNVAIFKELNGSKIFRVLSKIFRTKGTDRLSPEGLRSRSNNIRPEAVENMANLFYQCYNLCRTGKFRNS